MDHDWLFSFVVFAEHRSFTHAARRRMPRMTPGMMRRWTATYITR